MKDKTKILVVDDEEDVTTLLSFQLQKEDYAVETVNSPLTVMGKVLSFMPDLIILDVMMPELNGIQICRMIRADESVKATPIIFLTAKTDTDARITGLESGADDYICKPFEIKEVILRVKSILKRAHPTAQKKHSLEVGNINLDEDQCIVTIAGNTLDLTATEFKLLKLLMERKGRVQSRENLLINVWNYDADIETRTVDTHIRRLREKLGSEANTLETVRGFGYRLVDPKATS